MTRRGSKLHNHYCRELGSMYADTPKAVFAALAYSFAMRLNEDDPDAIRVAMCVEWDALHRANIVPQPAPTPAHLLACPSLRRGQNAKAPR